MQNGFRVLFALGLAAAALQVGAQAYPAKPVHIVVTFPPGGSTDAIARILSPNLAERLGQPFLVDNRPGGGAGRGNIGATFVTRSALDGYTLLVNGHTAFSRSAPRPMQFAGRVRSLHSQRDCEMGQSHQRIRCKARQSAGRIGT